MTDGKPADEAVLRHIRGIDQTLRAIAVGALLLVAVWAVRDLILVCFAAVLIACVLRGASGFFSARTGFGPQSSLVIVVLIVAACAASLVWWRGATIAEQALQMTDQLTRQAQQLWSELVTTPWGRLVAGQITTAINSLRGSLSGFVPGAVVSVLGIGGTSFVILATGLFLAAAPETYLAGSLRLMPVKYRKRTREAADQLGTTLQLWFLGQLFDMLLVTLMLGVGLFLLGLPLAATLAIFAGLLTFVPYIGALAGAIPAILVAFSQSPTLAIWVAVLFVSVQTIEGYISVPLIQKRTISLPPALTILSQTILGTLFGAFGLVLATPLIAAILTVTRLIYVEGFLEERNPDCDQV